MKAIYLLFILSFFLWIEGKAQIKKETVKTDSVNIQQIELTDGSIIFGYILGKVDKGIIVKTKIAGIINIEWDKIESVKSEVLENKNTGKVWFKNSNSTRYFVGPSAIPLKKREGYYQNTYVLLNSVNVGITNHISIGGGFEMLSLFNRNNSSFNFYLTPKIGYQVGNRNLYLGGGVLHVNMLQGEVDGKRLRQNFNIFYGSATIGNTENNFTVSSGWMLRNYSSVDYHQGTPVYDQYGYILYYNNGYHTTTRISEFNSNPIITISGMARVGRKISLITENWMIPVNYGSKDYMGLFSYGLRVLGEKTSFDFGFINNAEIVRGIGIGIPYLDIVIKF